MKSFSPTHTLTTDDIFPILEAARLAPSSYGVQPYFMHVVSTAQRKAAISPAAFSQPQITSCAHLVVFTARDDGCETVERYISTNKLEENSPGTREYAKYSSLFKEIFYV